MVRIATWNVNSINARLERVLEWLDEAKPDVVGFQELKCQDEKFPLEPLESLGYNVAVHGQKSYNGVALLSKFPMEDIRRGLPENAERTAQHWLVRNAEATLYHWHRLNVLPPRCLHRRP